MTCLQATVLATALLGWQTVSSGGETVLLDFTAEWCRSCREMDSTVDRLKSHGYPVRQVDYDRERATATALGVKSLPTFVMLVDGREVDRVEHRCRRRSSIELTRLRWSFPWCGAIRGRPPVPGTGRRRGRYRNPRMVDRPLFAPPD